MVTIYRKNGRNVETEVTAFAVVESIINEHVAKNNMQPGELERMRARVVALTWFVSEMLVEGIDKGVYSRRFIEEHLPVTDRMA